MSIMITGMITTIDGKFFMAKKLEHLVFFILSLMLASPVAHAGDGSGVEALLNDSRALEIPSYHPESKAQPQEETYPIVVKKLELDEAIRLALKHNAEIKASLAELGIAQANLMQAGLVQNPELGVSFGVQTGDPHFLPSGDLSQNFLDLFLVGLRKKVAESELKETEILAADRILDFIFRVQEAYFTLQGAEYFREQLRAIAGASQVSADLAKKIYEAGNYNLLQLNAQRLVAETAQIELARVETEIGTARETLLGLIGLKVGDIEIQGLSRLSPMPKSEPPLTELEKIALERRLDLRFVNQRLVTLDKNLGLAKRQFLSHFDFGVEVGRTDSGQPVAGPTIAVPLPVSDRNQAQKAKIGAQMLQTRHEVAATERRILTEVRSAHLRMLDSKKIAARYQNQVIPLLKKTLSETQLHYNYMLKSPFDLLQVKKEEISANRSYAEALRDYWIHRAQLERAIGAHLNQSSASREKK